MFMKLEEVGRGLYNLTYGEYEDDFLHDNQTHLTLSAFNVKCV